MELSAVAVDVCKQRNLELEKDIGSGAFKRAYLVSDAATKFALKVAPITASLKPRFQREADALRGCSHPSIARLHESYAHSYEKNEYWISIEEYLAGGTLAEMMAAGTIHSARVKEIGLSMADALIHLRQRSLVHRDIKPANILFRADGEPVLTDFGIVRVLDAPTLTKEFLPQGPGTPLYAAPEQLLNEIRLIDWRTDQFDLALVLSECVLGYHPYAPERDPHLAIGRMARRERLPEKSRIDLRTNHLGALSIALEPWPVNRFRTPELLIEALRRD